MVLLADAAGIMTYAGVEEDVVGEILAMLETGQDSVRKGEDMKPVPAGSLGGAATAAELQLHSGKAHTVVVEAMAEMVAGLKGYHESVKHFRKDVHDTDDDQAAELARRQQRLEQVQTQLALGESCTQEESFSDNTCQVPNEDG